MDRFDVVSYSNNDGSALWKGDWVEYGDDNQPGGGDIRIYKTMLRIRDDDTSIQRAVDLSDANYVGLAFTYLRDDLRGWIRTFEVSTDNGATWTQLESFERG